MRITDVTPARDAGTNEAGTNEAGTNEAGTNEAGTDAPAIDEAAFNRRKVYRQGTAPGVRVPFVEVSLSPTPGPGATPNAPVLLYDTSGPGSDPRGGLTPMRLGWISGRGDVVEHDGRAATLRDDGRGATRRGAPEAFPGSRRRPLVARGPEPVTQLHYALAR